MMLVAYVEPLQVPLILSMITFLKVPYRQPSSVDLNRSSSPSRATSTAFSVHDFQHNSDVGNKTSPQMMSSGHSLLSIHGLNIEYKELEAQFGELKGHVEMLTAEIRAIRDRETTLRELTPQYGHEQSNLESNSLQWWLVTDHYASHQNREASVPSSRLSDSEMDKSPGGRIYTPLGQPKKRRLKVEVWIDCPRLLNSPRAREYRNPSPEVDVDTAPLTFNRHGQVYEDINYEIDPNDMAVDLSLIQESRAYKGSTAHSSGYIRTDTEQPIPNDLLRRSLNRASALVNSRLAKANARLLAIDLDDHNKWVTVSTPPEAV